MNMNSTYRIVTICGSMRFKDQMMRVAEQETAKMRIVIMPFSVVAPSEQNGTFKQDLDSMHLAKIRMADEVVVVYDQTQYTGDSTNREISYADALGLPIRYETVVTDETLKYLLRREAHMHTLIDDASNSEHRAQLQLELEGLCLAIESWKLKSQR